MPRMTGGDAIVDSLLRHGIDTIFGLPGVQMYGLFDAFARNANRLKVINARHEQTTAYMALGYAQSTGKPSAFTVVPGPGRDEHHGRADHRVGRQRADHVHHRPGAERHDRPRARPAARDARPARHPEDAAEIRRAHRASDRGAAGDGARLPGDDVRPSRSGRRRDAVGHVPGERRRDADGSARQARQSRCPIPTRSRHWPSWSTAPGRR